MDKKLNIIDGGTLDERIAEMKEFFGLKQNQSFQELDVDVDEEEDE